MSFGWNSGWNTCGNWGWDACWKPCRRPRTFVSFSFCDPWWSCDPWWWDCNTWWGYRPVYAYYRPVYVLPSYSHDDAAYFSSGSTFADASLLDMPLTYSSQEARDLLRDGDAREARRAFDRAVSAYPSDGLPLVGYALSAGLLQRYDEAVDSMRRAMRRDPQSLNEVPQDDDLRQEFKPLLDYFEARLQQSPDDIDANFMIAALRYLTGDEAMAYFSIDRAMEAGDRDVSAVNLKAVIRNALDRGPSDRAPSLSMFEQAPPAPASDPQAQENEVEVPGDVLY
jgi:tetratricopeptide (TPR) repeat protein